MARIFLTGGNRGIGLALVTHLRHQGHEVFATSRKPCPQLKALGATVIPLDVTDAEQLAALPGELGDTTFDVLLHNAGVLIPDNLQTLDPDAVRLQFEVNALGPLLVTRTLLGALNPNAKVAIVTSRMGSITDNTSGGYFGYRVSKAAVNMVGMGLSHDLAGLQIPLVLLHPGYVRTDMTGGRGDRTPEETAVKLWTRIEELTMDTTGRFLHADGQQLPW